MRDWQKKQAEKIAGLLGQAHKEIRKASERGNGALAMDLLEQCQEAAIELGTMIEKEEGEGFVTVHLLEDYCERLYRFHEAIRPEGEASQDPAAGKREYKLLQKSLISIENSIRQDLIVKKEVVFLPYKAAMWDSLESVWKAADEDPACDAYVIPIPYYDRKPDGSFGEMHEEGDLYPDYVPITRYDAYDFEGRRPDMIFIHNPYDECNYVTSVHPFFYSSNLKRFTEKLVYIPYFILREIDPNDKAAVEGMKHFCTTPGVIHADKVIVQSEAMRQVYINVMTEYLADKGYPRSYWEAKIDGSGSPKVDKVLRTRKEDLKIPEDWQKILCKPDGSFKKIILYNTGVSALLRHEEKMLRKMKDVFRVFREEQEEVALLWRPHPLIPATIASMRPQLREEYEKLVEEYRAEGFGIYDDTADLDRAIALADAYYGDGSSLVQLCQKARMPVMVQSVEVVGEER